MHVYEVHDNLDPPEELETYRLGDTSILLLVLVKCGKAGY
jgi:hypothetical protein